ncbi:hypothetical protein J4G07_20305 [Candidatus Poribacteria bacterium]|nr:hypothetical protein [Candidatus Poribacteria bacterium]
MEKKIKHLEMIQNIITRLANNSFSLKGWTVIFIAAVLGFAIKESNSNYIPLVLFPIFAFWGLDGYYLRQEKLFRALYDKVRKLDEQDINFEMDTSSIEKEVGSWRSICVSRTILGFYGPILIVILILILIPIVDILK